MFAGITLEVHGRKYSSVSQQFIQRAFVLKDLSASLVWSQSVHIWAALVREASLKCVWILVFCAHTKANPGDPIPISLLFDETCVFSKCASAREPLLQQLTSQPSGYQSLLIEVHLLEKGLSKFVGADHNSTGWSHFYHPGQETSK